jgi:hypothetical protein
MKDERGCVARPTVSSGAGRSLPILVFALALMIVSPTQAQSADKVSGHAGAKSPQAPSASTVYSVASPSMVVVEAFSAVGTSQGSGVVYASGRTAQSYEQFQRGNVGSTVVSNAHVVKGAKRVTVRKGDKRYEAAVKYADDDWDLAILQVDGVGLPACKVDPDNRVTIGQNVYAIGAPLGLENSITEGIISAKRENSGITLLQTTAPISRGNSGGGLFDANGLLVGITTFKLMEGENLNFAVDAQHLAEIKTALWDADEIRDRVNGDLAPDQMARIRSHRFVKWLLSERDSGGEKLYQSVERNLERLLNKAIQSGLGELEQSLTGKEMAEPSDNSDPDEEIERFAHELADRFLLAEADGRDLRAESDETMRLVCQLSRVRHENEWSDFDNADELMLNLDYRGKTVNGYPAKISDSEVRWTANTKDGIAIEGVLNRYTGAFKIQRPESVFAGTCQPVTNKKF